MSRQREERAGDGLPPLVGAGASDDERARGLEARQVARHGAPTLEDSRRTYALAAFVRGQIAATAWVTTAYALSSPLWPRASSTPWPTTSSTSPSPADGRR